MVVCRTLAVGKDPHCAQSLQAEQAFSVLIFAITSSRRAGKSFASTIWSRAPIRTSRTCFRIRKFRFSQQDVSKYIEVEGPVDAVMHFASPASPPDYLEFPIQTLKVGALGTHNALGLAKAKKARFMQASTSECYGDPEVSPQPETYWGHVNPIGPRSVYDEAKRFAEAITMAYYRQHGVDTRIVRIFNTYGPRMRLNDGRALPNFLYQALVGEPITVYGDGKQTRSFCYVADLIDGIYRLLESKRARAGEHRQSRGNHDPGIRRARPRPGGDQCAHRPQAAAAGRSQAALPRHHQSQAHSEMGAEGKPGRGPAKSPTTSSGSKSRQPKAPARNSWT